MNVVGIITEYNPFHNGHLHHINECRRLYPDSILVLVVNGYFLERGEVSILSKEAKTKIALENAVDIVLELPFIYGSQSADIFASASVKILNNFFVDSIVFGSESNDIKLLDKVAEIQLNDNNYDLRVREYLNQGINYPTAMAKALDMKCDFNNPNDLLGISYIKAIKSINPKINAVSIRRTNSYHDILGVDSIVSASNIREKLKNNECIEKFVPNTVSSYINDVDFDKLFMLLKYKIITDSDLSSYLTVDEGIEYRLLKYISEVSSIDELITSVKTKRYTYNKINRMLIHVLVGLVKTDHAKLELSYIRILGFNAFGKEYLNSIKKKLVIPSVVDISSLQYSYELKAALLYGMLTELDVVKFENSKKPIQK